MTADLVQTLRHVLGQRDGLVGEGAGEEIWTKARVGTGTGTETETVSSVKGTDLRTFMRP